MHLDGIQPQSMAFIWPFFPALGFQWKMWVYNEPMLFVFGYNSEVVEKSNLLLRGIFTHLSLWYIQAFQDRFLLKSIMFLLSKQRIAHTNDPKIHKGYTGLYSDLGYFSVCPAWPKIILMQVDSESEPLLMHYSWHTEESLLETVGQNRDYSRPLLMRW